ncbi:MAG: hypothetical protein F6K50_29555 [Moorea sp. SIO3I7]|nr:hypothetical protein [Moorena sp. SIO3I7]
MGISGINIISTQPSNGSAIVTEFLDTVPIKADIRRSNILVKDVNGERFIVAFTPGVGGADFDIMTRVVIKV